MLTAEVVAWVCIAVFPNYCIFGWQLRCCGDLRRSGPVRVSTMCLSNLVPWVFIARWWAIVMLIEERPGSEITRQAIGGNVQYNDSDNPDALGHCATDSEGEDEWMRSVFYFYIFNSLWNNNKNTIWRWETPIIYLTDAKWKYLIPDGH